jgi:hypothetical protein
MGQFSPSAEMSGEGSLTVHAGGKWNPICHLLEQPRPTRRFLKRAAHSFGVPLFRILAVAA